MPRVWDIRLAASATITLVLAVLMTASPGQAAEGKRFRDLPKLKLVANIPMEKAREVAFSGKTAFVGRNLLGMTAVDIEDPDHPKILKEYPSDQIQPLGLKVIDGKTLVVADRFRGLVIWDVAKPKSPRELGRLALPGVATSLDVFQSGSRRYAIIACGGEGVCIVQITKSASPELVGRFTLDVDYSRRIIAADGVAYLADNFDGGLKVLDLTNPGRPTLLLKVALRGFCEAADRQKDILYCAYRNYGLKSFRIIGPRKTRKDDDEATFGLTLLCSNHRSKDRVRDIAVFDSMLVAADDEGGVDLYDVTKPDLPLLCDEFRFDEGTGASAQSCRVFEGYIYIPSWDGGLNILKVARRP